jgi:hypothetical protein
MNRLATIAIVLATLLLTNATFASAATLWDLLIKVRLERDQINLNEKPIIFGTILNQASKPVPGAEVKIRFSDVSATTSTDSEGNFRYEFDEQHVPGVFSLVVQAKSDDLKGFATTSLKIGKEASTFGDIYYNSNYAKTDEAANDPYNALKLKQYKKFLDEQNKRMQRQLDVEAKKFAIQEKRDIAQGKLDDAVKESRVGAGVYSGDRYDRYVSKLDPRIKSTIATQMNYTKQLFAEAQYAMKVVLDNGGSLQDAKKAYFEKLAISKDQLGEIGINGAEKNLSKIKISDEKKINSKKVKGLSYNKNLR